MMCFSKCRSKYIQELEWRQWQDDVEFWEQQKQEYLQSNPSHAGMFIGDDDEADLTIGTKNDEGTAM